MYADEFYIALQPILIDGLREGLRQFEENTGIRLSLADKESFISRVDLMSAIIDTFDPEAYGLSRAEGVNKNKRKDGYTCGT
jgi:hypothetical protein